MIVYDDLDPSERVKVYDKGITVANETELQAMLIGYRSGDVWSPRIEGGEALHAEAAHFLDCIVNRKKPLTDGEAGLRIVKMIEAADESIRLRGQPVELKP